MNGDVPVVGAQERIIATAYDLFAQRGIRDVGIDEVIARAGVAKATLYKYFRTKDDLVLAFLQRRDEVWTDDLVAEKTRRGVTPEAQLLAIFDVFDDWFADQDFDGCSFMRVLLEMGPHHPAGRASIAYMEKMRSLVQTRAEQAGLRDPGEFARDWHILMNGSIIAAGEGDQRAAQRAQAMGRNLIDTYRTVADPTVDGLFVDRDGRIHGESHGMAETEVGGFMQPHDHVVNIYDTDADVADDVSQYVADGLAADDAVVVIATPVHRAAIARRVSERGIDLAAAREAGRYRALDAAETLACFMVDGVVRRDLFVEVIGGVITQAGTDGRPVRAFGEMVALLWADDDVAGAIELEGMWNGLARSHDFFLYCAYPVDILARSDDLACLQQVCAHHSGLVAPRTYGSVETGIEDIASPAEDEATELYIPAPSAVRAARRFVRDRLTSWGQEAVVGDACLVVSELATNAVVHAGSPFRVSITRTDAAVKIAVEDLSPDQPVLKRNSDGPGGRGLLLVAALCSRWGVDTGHNGKSVWGKFPVFRAG